MTLAWQLFHTLAILLNPVYIRIIEILGRVSAAGIATLYGLDDPEI